MQKPARSVCSCPSDASFLLCYQAPDLVCQNCLNAYLDLIHRLLPGIRAQYSKKRPVNSGQSNSDRTPRAEPSHAAGTDASSVEKFSMLCLGCDHYHAARERILHAGRKRTAKTIA